MSASLFFGIVFLRALRDLRGKISPFGRTERSHQETVNRFSIGKTPYLLSVAKAEEHHMSIP